MQLKAKLPIHWRRLSATLLLAAGILGGMACKTQPDAEPPTAQVVVHGFEETGPRAAWKRHTIDDASKGADGTRLGDLNGDGLPDIVTGWEEGGVIRVCLHPGYAKAREKWPAVTAGRVISPEDAVFVDLDGDGQLDVVSSAEGENRSIYFHWTPRREELLRESAWHTEALPAAKGRMRWMFAAPAEIDGRNGIDLFAGGKDANGAAGWFTSPKNPRDATAWRWHPLREMGWLMSLFAVDMDGDGDTDLLLNDRKGPRRGIVWLEHPLASEVEGEWEEHTISPAGKNETMFLAYEDLDGDGLKDVIAAVKPRYLEFYRRLDARGNFAEPLHIPFPAGMGTAKGVAVGDINGDGAADLVISCENAEGEKRGVAALIATDKEGETAYLAWDISGASGTKFDLVKLLDVDGDGDLDVVTCEEKENLGVFWYENPAR